MYVKLLWLSYVDDLKSQGSFAVQYILHLYSKSFRLVSSLQQLILYLFNVCKSIHPYIFGHPVFQ